MTTDHYDLVIRGGECVTPKGLVQADIGVRAGRIAAMGDVLEGAERSEEHTSELQSH